MMNYQKFRQYSRHNEDGIIMELLRIILFLLFGFVTLSYAADIGKYFTKTPQSIVVPPGDHVTFECETNIPAEQVKWKLNGRFLHPHNDSDVRISGNFLYVKVSKNRERFLRQVGDYQCVIEFGAEALTSVPAQLTIAHIDEFLRTENASLNVVDGNTVAISCDAPYSNPSPIIQFYKDGKPLESEVGNAVLMDSGILHLRNVSTADSGYYWCSSTNHITSETYIANFGTHLTITSRNLTPRKSPEFLIKPKPYVVVPQDGNVTLECVAVGNPPPFVTWRKLRSSTMTNFESNKENLLLYNINFSQEGEYICEAYNGVGVGEKSLTTLSTIVLNSMPNITKEPVSIVVEEGGEAILDCSTEGLPKPRVYWIFNGHSVSDDGNVKIKDTGLRIASVEKKHAGLFQCFATNPMGTVTSPAELKVLAKQITAMAMANDSTDLANRGSDISPPPATRHQKTHSNKFHRGKHNKRRKHKGQDTIPPSKPHMNRVSDNSVMVRWSVPPNTGYPIQFFKIQYKEVSKRNSRWVTLDEDIPPHIHSFEVADLRVGQAYKFRIIAVFSNNDNKEGPNSEKFVLQKETSMKRPNFVPVVTTAAPHNTTSIILRWKHMRTETGGIDGYFIYYRESTSAGDYSKVTVLGSDAEAHYITYLKPGTAYDIKIQAFNKAGASSFSSINTAKTLGNATTEKPEDDLLRKKEIEFIIPDDPLPSNDRLYVLLGCLFAGFWIFLCIACALCYKCKQRKAEEEAKYPCEGQIEAEAKNITNGHVLNGYIPTIASHLELDDKETSFVERHNNNRPISPSQLNNSTCELGVSLGTFRSSGIDMRSWTEMKPVRTDKESNSRVEPNSRNNSLQKKKNHHIVASSGSLRRGPYVTCSNDELDKENFGDGRDTKIFPKEHYKGSRKHSLNRKRNSMGDG